MSSDQNTGADISLSFKDLRKFANDLDKGIAELQEDDRNPKEYQDAAALEFLIHSEQNLKGLEKKIKCSRDDLEISSESLRSMQPLMKKFLELCANSIEKVECHIEKYGYTRPKTNDDEGTETPEKKGNDIVSTDLSVTPPENSETTSRSTQKKILKTPDIRDFNISKDLRRMRTNQGRKIDFVDNAKDVENDKEEEKQCLNSEMYKTSNEVRTPSLDKISGDMKEITQSSTKTTELDMPATETTNIPVIERSVNNSNVSKSTDFLFENTSAHLSMPKQTNLMKGDASLSTKLTKRNIKTPSPPRFRSTKPVDMNENSPKEITKLEPQDLGKAESCMQFSDDFPSSPKKQNIRTFFKTPPRPKLNHSYSPI